MKPTALSLLPRYDWLRKVTVTKRPIIEKASPIITPQRVARFEDILTRAEKELIFVLFLIDLSSNDKSKLNEVVYLAKTPGMLKGFMTAEIATKAIKFFISWQIEAPHKTQTLIEQLLSPEEYA